MEQPDHNVLQDAPATQEDAINLRHYWHIILERRWLMITAFISVFVLSVVYLFKATPIYRATATLVINPEANNILRIEGMGAAQQDQSYLQTQYKGLVSPTLIERVIHDLQLDKDDPHYAGKLDTARAVLADIQIAPVRLSRLVDINVEHPDPLMAAKIANSLMTNHIELSKEQKLSASRSLLKSLEDISNNQSNVVSMAYQALQTFIEKNTNVSFESTENIIVQGLKSAQVEFDLAVNQASRAVTESIQVDILLSNGVPELAIPQLASRAEIQQLKLALDLAEAEFARVDITYGEAHPLYQQASTNVHLLRTKLDQAAKFLLISIRSQATIAEEVRNATERNKNTREAELIHFKNLALVYAELKRAAETSDLLYRTTLTKMKEAEITSKNTVDNLIVRDAATPPTRYVKPRALLTLFLGLAGGLGVALGLAFFVNYLDDSIKSQDDVETYLRLSFLGYVPNIKSNSVVERDLQGHLHPQSNAAEGFRTIRATISLTHKPERFRILSVTSTIPSEGKSLVASNLAIVIAQTGLRTLLVDADLRRPSVHKAFQLHSPKGLAAFLMGELNQIDDVLHKTEVPNLDVLCCGSVPSSPSELISSKRMQELLGLLRGKYDRVVIDSPPISAVSDPLMIAAMTDGVVFVTKFNKIRREHARKAVQRLHDAGIHILGVVLNDIDFEGKDSYYYSYYYYQNRYYSSHYRTGGGEPPPAKSTGSISSQGRG